MNKKSLLLVFRQLGYYLLFLLLLPSPSFAQSAAPPARLSSLSTVIAYGLRSVIGLVALVSLGMLIIGGYKYMSAGSDKNGSTAAQQTITYALGGLIVTMSAWVILNIMGLFVGVNLNSWEICIDPGVC